jgi:hypothetical protein
MQNNCTRNATCQLCVNYIMFLSPPTVLHQLNFNLSWL